VNVVTRTGAQGWRGGVRQTVALLSLGTLLAALPITAVAKAAEPVTLGEWMRIVFVTPDREIDSSQPGLAGTPPPTPPPVLQTSSEQTPPKPSSVVRDRLPDGWLRRDRARSRRRRVRRR
jgi:hypothetical protein